MSLYPRAVPAQLSDLPDGELGPTRGTLKHMVKLVRRFNTDVGVRELAQTLTRLLPGKAYGEELRVLQNFVRDRIRYVRDVRGVEVLQEPPYTLRVGSGDCASMAVLLASLLESIGFSTRFRAVGLHRRGYSHVLAEAKDSTTGQWVHLECIVPGAEPGWFPRGVTRSMFAHV